MGFGDREGRHNRLAAGENLAAPSESSDSRGFVNALPVEIPPDSGGYLGCIRGVHAEAPEVELDLAKQVLELRGGVRLTRGQGWLQADKATITQQKDDLFFRAESYGYSNEFMDYVRTVPIVPDRGSAIGRALLEGIVVHIPDVQDDADYTFMEAQRLGGFRTILTVPMLREGVPIGVIGLTRSEAPPFTDKQIELVTTFAD